MTESPFLQLAAINVNEHTEKKNGLTYLSWAWAVDQLMRKDPHANWDYLEPLRFGETMMVRCSVTAFGKTMTAQLPVMNHKNQPIANPDAFQVNTAMQRCLVKAIALHGLGLYIYSGEDLPLEDKETADVEASKLLAEYAGAAANGIKALESFHKSCKSPHKAAVWLKNGERLKEIASRQQEEVAA